MTSAPSVTPLSENLKEILKDIINANKNTEDNVTLITSTPSVELLFRESERSIKTKKHHLYASIHIHGVKILLTRIPKAEFQRI